MARVRRVWLGLLFALLTWPAVAAPLEAYGKLPSLEIGAVSASGDQVAVVVTNGEERRIVVKNLVKHTTLLLATVGETKVRDLSWAGDQHLIVTTSSTQKPVVVLADRSEWFFASEIDVPSKRLRALLGDVELSMNVLRGRPVVRMLNGKPIVMLQGVSFVNSHGVLSLFQIDLEHAASRLVEVGLTHTDDFVVGADGQPVAQTLYDSNIGTWTLKLKTGPGWRDVLTRVDPIDTPELLGLGRDGRSVLVSEDDKQGHGWREFAPDGAGPGGFIPASVNQEPIHDPATGRLIGYTGLVGDELHYTFFDPADEKVWKAVVAAFPGDRVDLISWSNDRRRILVEVDSATLGPAFAVIDLATRKASSLGAEYQALKAADIAQVTPLRFKAADGLDLTGYLTLPNGREPKALPLIVFPHGGPAARDVPGFDWWAQAMASRGYAVLQVNYRGSDGFGWDFQKAGFGEWGRKMQTDLSDGVRYLAGQGTIDPKRVCIVGGSYGGYAALAGATIEKGVYRCAVAFGGVCDLKRMVAYSKGRSGNSTLRYWTRYMGAKDLGDPVLTKYSPALQAASASAPVLLIHGRDDTVVPLDQSTEMADALKRAGKPVELVVQNHADHWLSLGATRLQMLQATMAFVEKNNPPN
jgi:dipeptidyl aminopeptidase/acylaminoacyl peptidase